MVRYGRWTIISEKRKNGRKYYECRCDCGTVKDVYYRAVEKGASLSCGCLRRELQSENMIVDLTGRRFGKLTVLYRDDNLNNLAAWMCECDCGNRKRIRGTSLTRKKDPTRSCGCEHRKAVVSVGAKTIHKNSERQIKENMAYHTNFQVIGTSEPGKNNKSGHKGIWWDGNRCKWVAYIQVHGVRKFLGRFDDKEDAIAAREEAEDQYFKPLLESAGKVR